MTSLLLYGMILWITMLTAIHCFNYKLLNAVPLYLLQERFYADIFQLNYRTNQFILPSNTFGNDFSDLDETLFRQKFQPDVVFIQNAFKHINAKLPHYVHFVQVGVVLPHQEFLQNQNNTFHVEYFRSPGGIEQRIFDESVIRKTFPEDYKTLRNAWFERILMNPVDYIKWKSMVFIKYCQKTSISFWGLSVSTILMLTSCLAVTLTFSHKRLEESVFPSIMLAWSALLYISPLLIFLTDDREIRYVYWFLAASLIAMTHLCANSELIRTLLKLTMNCWETKLRDIANSLK